MGNVTKRVTEELLLVSRTLRKSIAGLALYVFFTATAQGDGKISAEAQSAQGATGQGHEFYVSLSTDERDQPGLSTLVVAGSNRFMFDCGVVGSALGGGTAPFDMTALFLTKLDATTAENVDRALSDVPASPQLHIWGPPGTREWMLKAFGHREVDPQRPLFTVIDLQEGVISEAGKPTITAIETAPSRFAYRVGFEGHSLLIATDVTYSEHVVASSAGVDVVGSPQTSRRFVKTTPGRCSYLA